VLKAQVKKTQPQLVLPFSSYPAALPLP
jgi:hypothetical protein